MIFSGNKKHTAGNIWHAWFLSLPSVAIPGHEKNVKYTAGNAKVYARPNFDSAFASAVELTWVPCQPPFSFLSRSNGVKWQTTDRPKCRRYVLRFSEVLREPTISAWTFSFSLFSVRKPIIDRCSLIHFTSKRSKKAYSFAFLSVHIIYQRSVLIKMCSSMKHRQAYV